MAFTSCISTRSDLFDNTGLQPYVIRGELYHLHGPLQHTGPPTFAQTYLYDPQAASSHRFLSYEKDRTGNMEPLRESILRGLAEMLESCGNPFIELYRTAKEILDRTPTGPVRLALNPRTQLIMTRGADQRRNNMPTSNEIAAVIPDDPDTTARDIILFRRDENGQEHNFHRIWPTHPGYMPLQYPLLFPHGDPGWDFSLELVPGETEANSRTKLTQQMWYRYHGFERKNQFNIVQRSHRLAQRFIVDSYAAIEKARLDWVAHHQHTIRAELYNGLHDAVHQGDTDARVLGKKTILPASFTGGDRFMHKLFQDSMAITRVQGPPTLFVTMTANPKWPDLLAALPPGVDAIDAPAITARIFNLKRKALLQDLREAFGVCKGLCWTVEYQKRGLPHCHILLILDEQARYLDPVLIDKIICAEFPDPAIDPSGRLQRIVESTMLHGPCGDSINPKSPCMAKNKYGKNVCSKNFPKAFQPQTVVDENSYPRYRRREDGRSVKRTCGDKTITMTNQWIVPYSPYLLLKYNCHINVELSGGVSAIKYIHKYVYKGGDRTTLAIQTGTDQDEITQHLNGRYIGPMQAAYQINEFRTHEEWPAVEQLEIHLENQQPVFFADDADEVGLERVLERSASKLTAFFKYNAEHEDSRHYLYRDFPQHFVWVRKQPRHWKARERGTGIGRIVFLRPEHGERYYLAEMLRAVPGPTSFQNLRTVNGHEHPTFKDACRALGLLDNDREWISCFTEAASWRLGRTIRNMFVGALRQGTVNDPRALWDQFRADLCDDLSHQIRQRLQDPPTDMEHPEYDYGLYLIATELRLYDQTLSDHGLPEPVLNWEQRSMNARVAVELDYDAAAEAAALAVQLTQMNRGQRTAYDTIVTAIENDVQPPSFFLSGPGGTGKTFLYQALAHKFRSQGEIVLCVASSGIASLLLPGGRTAHSCFKIPVPCHETSTCSISKQGELAGLLRRTRFIIWDEATMQHQHTVKAVSRTLSDIRDNETAFGGIPVLFGGDWAQCLPVVRNGSVQDTIGACICKSTFWPELKILRLTENMRVGAGSANAEWARWLAAMPYDRSLDNTMEIPDLIRNRVTESSDLIDRIYPEHRLPIGPHSDDFLTSRAILAPYNDSVQEINTEVLNRMPGDSCSFLAVDKVEDESEDIMNALSPETLASLNPPSLPPATLELKVGTPVMLMRNLHPNEGMCNGTRLIVTKLSRFAIQARIITGPFKGQMHGLFRVHLSSNEGELPWVVTRKQFPIRVAFAMTINKSQGQSLANVGLDLRRPCFSHGQLYVGFSRVTNVDNLTILQYSEQNGETNNVYYPEVLLP